ncbi:MAG: EamA family transporter RarD [Syntrophomonadaceae bacterium]|jgi:chloramphenicol-sensitive protein RarD|nr:EamA family transporter RarD [Syntrophomonadaceae bacterium]
MFNQDSERSKGVIFVIGSYLIWGTLPLYWKMLQEFSSLRILGHRIIWGLVFLLCFLIITRKWYAFWAEVKKITCQPRKLLAVILTGFLLNLNWLTFIWAVNNDRIIQTSLGYYINPLINVLLGIVFLRERLSFWQLAAFGLAAAGVLSLTVQYGAFPVVALTLAVSFSIYTLLKKLIDIDPITGLTLETMLTSVFALGCLLYANIAENDGALQLTVTPVAFLFVGAGIVTAAPLMLYTIGARLLPLFAVGFFQYISPTMTLFLGVVIFHEPFTRAHLFSFLAIWISLILFSLSKTPVFLKWEKKLNAFRAS